MAVVRINVAYQDLNNPADHGDIGASGPYTIHGYDLENDAHYDLAYSGAVGIAKGAAGHEKIKVVEYKVFETEREN
jgi:hypothetical protein